jgi:hypothetical protein
MAARFPVELAESARARVNDSGATNEAALRFAPKILLRQVPSRLGRPATQRKNLRLLLAGPELPSLSLALAHLEC